MAKPWRRGLVIGKFLPPHRGHRFLIDFAAAQAEHLTVLVCTLAEEPIPGPVRFGWMRESFERPGVAVLRHDAELPQEPAGELDHRFWTLWRESIRRLCPAPDAVFASEAYGARLAMELGANWVPVDVERTALPVAARTIRAQPFSHWAEILPVARPWFLRRVAIVGPESSGKTCLVRDLAQHFDTGCWVPEYARGYLDALGDPGCGDVAHITAIAHGQAATEAALTAQARRLLICDTDLITTSLWAQVLFGRCPDGIDQWAQAAHYDLTLVQDVAPWIADEQRHQPAEADRTAFRDALIARLERAGRRWLLLQGDWRQRREMAVAALTSLLA
ncbi:HTH-type transcriptional regulator, transcriptional repressor of NAD biosynthesis genes [uncultured Gammaproteobacteria bacterium]